MGEQKNNGFNIIVTVVIIILVIMCGITVLKQGEVSKQQGVTEDNVISKNDSAISADNEEPQGENESAVNGENKDHGNDGDKQNNDNKGSESEDNLKDEDDKIANSGKVEADDEKVDSDKGDLGDGEQDQDTEKSEVEKAIEAIKGGNLDIGDFQENVVILVKNDYTEDEIKDIIGMEDSDNDELGDYFEKLYNTDINNEDSDGDGLKDGEEVFLTVTDPSLKDTDGNGIDDGDEDSDEDGLTDKEEMYYGTNPILKDSEGDGLTDFEEVKIYGIDPLKDDTDDDGVDDYSEIFITKTNPKQNDSENKVNVEVSAKNNYMKLNIQAKGSAKSIYDLSALQVPESSILSSDRIDGMYGTAYDFSSSGIFEECNVTIDIIHGNSNAEYGLYYFNENDVRFEYVKNQSYVDGKITAELEHFSKYVVLDRKRYVESSKNVRNIVSAAYGKSFYKDSDGDGFVDAIDHTPASADCFATYEKYLKYFYGNSEILSVFVQQPKPGTGALITKDENGELEVGHTFMSYAQNGDMDYSGFYPAIPVNIFKFGSLGKLSTADGVYLIDEEKGQKELVKYGENFNGSLVTEEANYDKYHSWNIALPIIPDKSLTNTYEDYYRGYFKNYHLSKNNCTTFVLEFLKDCNIKKYIFPSKYAFSLFNKGGSPAYVGQCLDKFYPSQSVRTKDIRLSFTGINKAYYSKMSEKLAFDTQKPSDDDYIPVTEKLTEFNGHYYGVIKLTENDDAYDTEWDQAKAAAKELGGYLAVITSKEEDDFCYNLTKDVYGILSCYFGLSDANTEGVWEWVNGEVFEYQNWQEGEPNNQGGRENYGMYYHRFGSSKWNDGNGNDGVGMYLVEFDKKPENLN